MDKQKYTLCQHYFEEMNCGVFLYFNQGYLTATSYTVYDLLRRIVEIEPEFLLNDKLARFGQDLGFKLPASKKEIKEWENTYLNVPSLAHDIKEAYGRQAKPGPASS
jgi:hypothetical protein